MNFYKLEIEVSGFLLFRCGFEFGFIIVGVGTGRG